MFNWAMGRIINSPAINAANKLAPIISCTILLSYVFGDKKVRFADANKTTVQAYDETKLKALLIGSN